MVGLVGAGGHVVQALADDAQALADFLHPHHAAVVAIAVGGQGHFKVELVVAAVGALLAQVPVEASGAHAGAGDAPLDGLRAVVLADADGAPLEDAVLRCHLVVVVHAGRHVVHEVAHHRVPAFRQVLADAANAEPGRMHAPAGDGLDDAEQPLPVGEHVEHRRHLADILGEGAKKQQVAGDAEEFRHHDADHLGPIRHLDAGHLLDRHHVGQVVHHPAEVVHPVSVGDVGVPGLPLAHLLGAPVVVADVRHRIDHDLAVKLQGNAEHAVNAGVVGAQVQEHEVRVLGAAGHAPLLGLEAQAFLLGVKQLVGHAEGVHLRGAGRMLLAQRMPFPQGRRENAVKVRMAFEVDPEHVVGLALVPIGSRPNGGEARQVAVTLRQRHLDAQIRILRQGNQVVEHREVGLRQAIPIAADALIHGGKVEQQGVVVLQPPHDLQQAIAGHPQVGDAVRGLLEPNVVAQALPQRLQFT